MMVYANALRLRIACSSYPCTTTKKSTHYIIQHGTLIQKKKCTPHVQKRAGGWQVLVGEGSLNKHQSNEVCIARVLKKVIVPRVQ